MRKIIHLCLMSSIWMSAFPESKGQEGVGVVELHAEALSAGATVTLPAGSEWSFGVDLSAGKHLGLDLMEVESDLDLFGVGYTVLSWRPNSRLQIALSPIGFAAVFGNDFGAVYPSGRLGIGHFWGRIGVGTELRIVRIAGGYGTGDYWLHWSPIRVSLRIGNKSVSNQSTSDPRSTPTPDLP